MKHFSMKTTFGLCATTLLLATACTQELADNPAGNARAISFQTPQADTRAAVNGNGDLGNFSVWGWYGETEGSTDKNVFDGKEIKAPNWTYDGGAQYWIPGKKYNFYGVYPANAGRCTQTGTITVEDFDCSKYGLNAVDLMTAVQPGLLGDDAPTVTMPFKHTLTRITFSAKLAEGLDEKYSLKVNEVALWASNKGTMTQDMSQPDSQPVWETEPYLKNGDDEGDINEAYNAYLYQLTANDELINDPIPTGETVLLNVENKGDLLVIPQKMSDTRPVLAINYTLSYEGSTTSPIWKTYPLKNNTDWTPGTSLNYTFTIDEDNAYFNVSIGDWEDGNKGNEDIVFE